jgi:hypothetical protein
MAKAEAKTVHSMTALLRKNVLRNVSVMVMFIIRAVFEDMTSVLVDACGEL